jgi:hypothetical protein
VVFEWHSQFKASPVSLEDGKRSGQQSTSKMTKILKNLRTRPRRLSLHNPWARRHCWNLLWSLPGYLNRKFEYVPHCRKVCALTLDRQSKARCINVCIELHEKANKDPAFISILLFPKLNVKTKGTMLWKIKGNCRQYNSIKEYDFHSAFEAWKTQWDRCIHSKGDGSQN